VISVSRSSWRAGFALVAMDPSRQLSWTVADTWSPRKRAGAEGR
jgi:hypothetical protein